MVYTRLYSGRHWINWTDKVLAARSPHLSMRPWEGVIACNCEGVISQTFFLILSQPRSHINSKVKLAAVFPGHAVKNMPISISIPIRSTANPPVLVGIHYMLHIRSCSGIRLLRCHTALKLSLHNVINSCLSCSFLWMPGNSGHTMLQRPCDMLCVCVIMTQSDCAAAMNIGKGYGYKISIFYE